MITDKQENLIILILLFLISLSYISFFTECVPFFFDDHEFHANYVHTSYSEHFSRLVQLSPGTLITKYRPVYGLYVKTLFPFFGYDYCLYRIAKGIVFSMLMLLVYALQLLLLKHKRIAIISTLYFMITFPLYLQTFGYNGPHIFAELFKIAALLLFIRDLLNEKTSITRQVFIFLFAGLAIRSYSPAFSIAGILPLFTLLYTVSLRKHLLRYFKRYCLLFLLILLIQFPIATVSSAISGNAFSDINTGIYTPKFVNIKHVFFNDLQKNLFNPVPSYSELYYKSFSAIVTFFGFWLIIISGVFISLRSIPLVRNKLNIYFYSNENKEPNRSKLIVTLTVAWMLCELPYYLFLPEHAIRYIMSLFVPLTIWCTLLIVTFLAGLRQPYKRYATFFVFIMLGGAMLTNISYTYAFRAGWGSSFIVFEKVMDHFAERYTGERTGVLYFAQSVADEYFFVNKSSRDYTFAEGIDYIKSGDTNNFSEDNIQSSAEKYAAFYVLKRITSVNKVGYPDMPLENYQLLTRITIVDGISENILFDRVNRYLMALFNIRYSPNKIIIYQYITNTTH